MMTMTSQTSRGGRTSGGGESWCVNRNENDPQYRRRLLHLEKWLVHQRRTACCVELGGEKRFRGFGMRLEICTNVKRLEGQITYILPYDNQAGCFTMVSCEYFSGDGHSGVVLCHLFCGFGTVELLKIIYMLPCLLQA